MIENIYQTEELSKLQGSQLQQKANIIKQRFDQVRNYYYSFRNPMFYSPENWLQINEILTQFDSVEYRNWNTQWSNIQRNINLQNYQSHFEQGKKKFKQLENKINKVPQLQNHSKDVEALKANLLEQFGADIGRLKEYFSEQISSGIQDLVALKKEYKLANTFSNNIETLTTNSRKARERFMVTFIISIFLIPIAIILSYQIEKLNELNVYFQIGIRISITLALAALSLFLFNQYRIYQIMTIKYSHLNNFIGGGATFLSELIDADDDEKKQMNRKVANMFIDIGDLMNVVKKSKHASEMSVESITKTLDSLGSSIEKMKK